MTELRSRARRAATRPLSRLIPPIRSFIARRRRVAAFSEQLLDRAPFLVDALFAVVRGDPERRYQDWVAQFDTIDQRDVDAIRAELASWSDPPLLSVVVPLPDCDAGVDVETSLRSQIYERFETHLVTSGDPGDWNATFEKAGGEYAVVADPAIELRPHALFLIAQTLARRPDALLVYGDEDEIDDTGARKRHYFKPDWNEALLRSQNYLGGVVCFRRDRALAVGGCEDEIDGDCAWGLYLRITVGANPKTIHHLPFVLSHRRLTPRRTARHRVARAVEARLTRLGEQACVDIVGEKSYRARYALPSDPPLVSVIVPTSVRLDVVRPCLESVLKRTDYPAVEIVLVVSGAGPMTTDQRRYLEEVGQSPQVRTFFCDDRPFNFSRTNNWAVERARGRFVCFLNDDTEVIAPGWLAAMLCAGVRPGVGAVGAMLVYPNDRIQHAGVVLGVGHVAGHAYARRPRGIAGYHDRALVEQELSCVTAACMLVRREVFRDLGGFDETFEISFNDIDFCLRLRQAGWRIVWTPAAELYHHESASIVRHDSAAREQAWRRERCLIHRRWGDALQRDAHYNPNLSLDALRLWEPSFPPRVSYPWRLVERDTRPVA